METSEKIFISSSFPDEYAGSESRLALKGAVAKAKANAVQGIPELIEIATNGEYSENTKKASPAMERSRGTKFPHCIKNLLTEVWISAKIAYRKGVTVKQRFASVKCKSKKQPNFGQGGCFFDVFYFFRSAGY